jgi:hypothetical protein
MNTYQINDFNDLFSLIKSKSNSNLWIYRGQSNIEWDLIPKIGRYVRNKNWDDRFILESWYRKASVFMRREINGWWERLALAQHYGLPTRLLDWTYTPTIAVFFAVIENLEKDGLVYAYEYNKLIIPELVSPFDVDEIVVFRPTSIDSRIFNQSSIFTIQPDPRKKLGEEDFPGIIEKWVVKASYKKVCQAELNQLGINYSTLFPDLTGMTKHSCWYLENRGSIEKIEDTGV